GPEGRGGDGGSVVRLPEVGTVERVVLVVLARGASVLSLAVLADGRLASGGSDGAIKLWPKEGTGEPVVLAHGARVLSLAVLADGRLASGGSDGAIKLWPEEGSGGPAALGQRAGVYRPAERAGGSLGRGRPGARGGL